MRHHLALGAEDRGSTHAALRQFGNVTLLKEKSRAMWTWNFWEQLTQDIRYGLRAMAANPLFTAMAVLSLALGIGANTAIYSFMDAILLRSLPVQHPEQLVVVNWRAKDNPTVIHGQNGSRRRDGNGMSSPNYPFGVFQLLRSNQEPLASLFAYATAWEINLVAENQAEIADGQLVSGGFYNGLGVSPAAGRLIMDDDDRTGAAPVAVLSYQYWQSRFAASPAAVGRQILINNTPFTIVGVSAPGFFGVNPDADPKVYLPLHSAPLLAANPADDEKRRFFDNNFYWLEMMGRLRPGVSVSQAQAALAGRFHPFVESTATTAKEKSRSAGALAPGRCGRTGLAAAALLKAPLRTHGDGRPDSRHRLRQHRQSPARALHGPAARDGGAPQPGRGTSARGSPTVDRKRAAVPDRRLARSAGGTLGNPFDHLAAGQRTREFHASCEPELAGAGFHAGPCAGHGAGLRSGSCHTGDEGGPDARAQGNPCGCAARIGPSPGPRDQPQPRTGRVADRHLVIGGSGGRPVRAHAVQSSIGGTWLQ